MSVEQPIERASRARPVAGAPVDALLARGDELTRRWAVALIRSRPLGEMPEIPLERLAREGPALCEQIARALDSDEALDRLAPAAEPDAGERRSRPPSSSLLVGADARSVVEDLEALRAILWEALLEELREPSPRLVADLADRLACVCSAALATMLERLHSGAREPFESPAARHPTGGRVLYDAPPAARGRGGAVLIDELEDVPLPLAASEAEGDEQLGRVAASAAAARAGSRPATAPPMQEQTPVPPVRQRPTAAPARGRPRPWDTPLGRESQGSSAAREGDDGTAGAGRRPGAAPEMRIRRIASSPSDESGQL